MDLGWQDSNLRMPDPKPGALPLGHTPILHTEKLAHFMRTCNTFCSEILNYSGCKLMFGSV